MVNKGNTQELTLVYIDDRYTDFLQENGDTRVSKNINNTYQRPYLGVLFELEGFKYFAPLTTSSKGKKLKDNPKDENITFYPIAECKYGGINLNNMIPLVEGVSREIDLEINNKDFQREINKKVQLLNIKRALKYEGGYLIAKAVNLYSLKTTGKLYSNYDQVTCDFKALEIAAAQYNANGKEKTSPQEQKTTDINTIPNKTPKMSAEDAALIEKYNLAPEKLAQYKRVLEGLQRQTLEGLIRQNIKFSPQVYGELSDIITEEDKQIKQSQKDIEPKTQDKTVISVKMSLQKPTPKKPNNNDCNGR
jgi:hypothetical protein